MKRNASKDQCPHCGGRQIEDNGLRRNHPDLTLLCVTPVEELEASLDYYNADVEVPYDANGKVPCGHQWNPNQEGAE